MSEGETQLVQELRALAGAKEGDSFPVTHDGVTIRISYTGGSSSSLVLRTDYDASARDVTATAGYRGHAGLAAIRPMNVKLRPETDTHRRGKQSGMDVEFQTGDPAFDGSVYVDTATPTQVLVHVLEEGARRAVGDLFALDFTDIVIDDLLGDIRATLVSFPTRARPEPTGARAIDAFARLARAMPRIARVAGQHASHPLRGTNILLGVVAALTLGGAVLLYRTIAAHRCPNEMSTSEAVSCVGPGIPGILCGLVAATIAGLLASRFTRRYRGRSNSSSYGATFAWLVAVIVFSVTSLSVASVAAVFQGR